MNYITGKKLMSMNVSDIISKYKYKIIHQTWKNTNIINDRKRDFESWYKHHPAALHVLWTDQDNLIFINKYYPEFLEIYNLLFLTIQKVDLIRLLYLHRYGGLYADLDYQAFKNIFEYMETSKDWKNANIFIVRSEVLFNEVFQNSLMFSKNVNNLFRYECVKSIEEIVLFINKKKGCCSDFRKASLPGCEQLRYFKNPITKKSTNIIFTLYITGPAVIDKTLLRLIVDKNYDNKIIGLPSNKFYLPEDLNNCVAKHHQANSWVKPPITKQKLANSAIALISSMYLYKISSKKIKNILR